MMHPLTVAWISDFPIEWLPDIPPTLKHMPRQHPATWQMVLLSEFEKDPSIQLHVIVLRKNISQNISFQLKGVTFHILRYLGGLRATSLYWVDTILIRQLLQKIQPDIVHAWGSERGAALVASRLSIPSLVTVQGLLTWYREIVPVSAAERFAAWTESLSFHHPKIVTTESKFSVAYLNKKYPGLSVHQIEHAPNWLFHHLQRRPKSSGVKFVSIGTLGFRKGSDLLLRALDKLVPELDFDAVVIGGGNNSFVQSLKSTLSPQLWTRISFEENLTATQIAAELATSTMLLLPTRADTSPNAVKEAVVAGVPVVASNIGGIPDYVFPDQNGFLFESGNIEQFTSQIRRACQHDLFSKGQVTAESLSQNREYLSPNRMASLFKQSYFKVLEKSGHHAE